MFFIRRKQKFRFFLKDVEEKQNAERKSMMNESFREAWSSFFNNSKHQQKICTFKYQNLFIYNYVVG